MGAPRLATGHCLNSPLIYSSASAQGLEPTFVDLLPNSLILLLGTKRVQDEVRLVAESSPIGGTLMGDLVSETVR
jgi:hypothetical protein